jgi:hypothetical protein
MLKSSLLQYTLTALSALILIPLTYSLITRQDAKVTTVDAQLSLAIHRPLTHQASSHHSCNHCAEPLPGDRQAAQFQKIAAAGMLWEKSSPDPSSAAPSMRITSGMPKAKQYQEGSHQKLTLEDGTNLEFTVKHRHLHSDGTVAVNAIIPGTPEGRLHMQWNQSNGFFLGQIEYPHHAVAYEINQNSNGESIITRRSIDQLVCAEVEQISQQVSYGLPAPSEAQADEAPGGGGGSDTGVEPTSSVPALNSYPSAEAVVYLDFDGEIVEGTIWGSKITAVAPGYSDSVITYIWKIVSTDMEPFNINVTTDESVYLNAPPSKRIRCIITPSSAWSGSSGGIAYRNSFTWTGDTPCWVFSDNLNDFHKSIGETCSHEVGHSFGLTHDGWNSSSYYPGHGSGNTKWSPIMGVSHNGRITQWSKGEYAGATNTEDDLAIITSATNGFGYRNDDHNGHNSGATPMANSDSDQVSHAGVIEGRGDVDVFSFTSGAGSISIDIDPTISTYITNLDIEAKLYDDKGELLVSANPETVLDASISTTVEGGTYFLHVQATGYGTADTGYTDYASLGSYVINGQVTSASPPPPALTPYEQTVASLSEIDRSLEGDPDGDGLNNLTEHAFGTNPAIANGAQRFTRIDPAGAYGADFLLDLPGDIPADALYTVEATCDLAADGWSSIASRDTAGNWSGTATVGEETGPEGKRRFRISYATEESWTCRFMRVRFHLAITP